MFATRKVEVYFRQKSSTEDAGLVKFQCHNLRFIILSIARHFYSVFLCLSFSFNNVASCSRIVRHLTCITVLHFILHVLLYVTALLDKLILFIASYIESHWQHTVSYKSDVLSLHCTSSRPCIDDQRYFRLNWYSLNFSHILGIIYKESFLKHSLERVSKKLKGLLIQ